MSAELALAAAREAVAAAPPAGLYLHVPFCVSHCPYCDFVVVAGRAARGPGNRIGAFVDALQVELGLRADALDTEFGPVGRRPALGTVYLGGGTPSLLPPSTIAELLELARGRFGIADEAEVTLEVNPGADERGDAAAQRAAGVTRMSVGAQSMGAGELRRLGRRHTPTEVSETVAAARGAGIGSVSIDLLYDIPGQSIEAWAATLDAVLRLEPDHLSLYALSLDDPDAEGLAGPTGDHLPVSRGARAWRDRARGAQDDDRAADMYQLADARLQAAGYAWYEISNWARPSHESRHNLGYWQGRPWEAVGPGAHAFDGRTRRWNAARLDSYIAALTPRDGSPAQLPPGGATPAADADGAIAALRTRDGLAATALDAPATRAALVWGLDVGLLVRTPADRVVLTTRGRLLSNELFAKLV